MYYIDTFVITRLRRELHTAHYTEGVIITFAIPENNCAKKLTLFSDNL